VSYALLALDTDHIKGYVFGTSRLKEIRGASSRIDHLNRIRMNEIAEKRAGEDGFTARKIFAYGGSGLFLIISGQDQAREQAEELGREIQQLYHKKTGGGASISYAVQPIPYSGPEDIMEVEKLDGDVTMQDVLKLLGWRLRLAKDSPHMDQSQDSVRADDSEQDEDQEEQSEQDEFWEDDGEEDETQEEQSQQNGARKTENTFVLAVPSHALLRHCKACGVNYAEDIQPHLDSPGEQEGPLCCACIEKRVENKTIKKWMEDRAFKASDSERTLWGRILRALYGSRLASLSSIPDLPEDFETIGYSSGSKNYLGLIYADANGMGKAMADKTTLKAVEKFAKQVDDAVFEAMGAALKAHFPLDGAIFPFDVLLVGGDDIVIVIPAQKALQVAYRLAESFQKCDGMQSYTLSVGVVLAPVKYPFNLQYQLVNEVIKAAKMGGANHNASGSTAQEESYINFVAVTGNTSLNYGKVYAGMTRIPEKQEGDGFFATMRPYPLQQFDWLIKQVQAGNKRGLGRTKLHQLREAILKLNRTTTILESLMILGNWRKSGKKEGETDAEFIKKMVNEYDKRDDQAKRQETLFPWYLDGEKSTETMRAYCTPLLDFVELYDFVTLQEVR
jgi:CRISPR RNA silencing complex Cmr2 subunit-like protein